MGMFDRVWAKCPRCTQLVEFQSKAGKCELIDYTTESLPPELARNLANEVIECPTCETKVKLVLSVPIPRMSMQVVDADTFKTEEY